MSTGISIGVSNTNTQPYESKGESQVKRENCCQRGYNRCNERCDQYFEKIAQNIGLASFMAAAGIGLSNFYGLSKVNDLSVSTNKFVESFKDSGCASLNLGTVASNLTTEFEQRNSYSDTYFQYPIVDTAALTAVVCLGVIFVGKYLNLKLLGIKKEATGTEKKRIALEEEVKKINVESKSPEPAVEPNAKENVENSCASRIKRACNWDLICKPLDFISRPVRHSFVRYGLLPQLLAYIASMSIEYLKRPISCLDMCASVKDLTAACHLWKTGDCPDECVNTNVNERMLIVSALTVGTAVLAYFLTIKPYIILKKQIKAGERYIEYNKKAIEKLSTTKANHEMKLQQDNAVASKDRQKEAEIEYLKAELQKARAQTANSNERSSVEEINDQGRDQDRLSIATTASNVSADGASPLSTRSGRASPTSEVVVHVDNVPKSTVELTTITVTA